MTAGMHGSGRKLKDDCKAGKAGQIIQGKLPLQGSLEAWCCACRDGQTRTRNRLWESNKI